MPLQIINANATVRKDSGQPYIEVNDGPNNTGIYTLSINDPVTGAPLATLAHLANSFDQADIKYFLTPAIDQLPGTVVVCMVTLARVAPGPLIFQVWLKQDGVAVAQPTAEARIDDEAVNIVNLAFRITLAVAP